MQKLGLNGQAITKATWDHILTTTMAAYRKKLIDNILDAYPTLRAMTGGRVSQAVRGISGFVDALDMRSGGESIAQRWI